MIDDKGVSILELAIAVVIIGVLATIAIPNFQSWIAYQQLRSDTTQVSGDLQSARITAINQNVPITLKFNTPAAGQYIAFVDNGSGGGTARDLQQNGTETLLFTRTLNPADQLLFTGACANGAAVLFNAKGFLGAPLGGNPWCVILASTKSPIKHQVSVSWIGDVSAN